MLGHVVLRDADQSRNFADVERCVHQQPTMRTLVSSPGAFSATTQSGSFEAGFSRDGGRYSWRRRGEFRESAIVLLLKIAQSADGGKRDV